MKRVQSPSSINTYLQCPRKYYYIYNLKLPTLPSIHLVRGSVAHSALEHFFDFGPDQRNFRSVFQKRILELFREHWGSADFSGLDLSPEELQFYHDETQMMLVNWVNQFSSKMEKFMGIGLSFNEAFAALTPKREVFIRDPELMVQGYIDTVEEIDGNVRLMDYKTSKTPKMTDAYLLQLGIYALLYKRRFGKVPSKVGIYFLKDTEHLLSVSEGMIRNAQAAIEQIHSLTESDKMVDYPLNPSPLCKWSSGQCDFYDYCFNGKEVPKTEKQSGLGSF
ncbi:PD-(D/E)XK nuclease family protein [Candidatus Woesearchaeota archaeon]|nr:PD-(D/E)XK nuclease family protein [Candidatus Woesearchaeota archaeon]